MDQPKNTEMEKKQFFVPCASPSGADRYSAHRTVGSRETEAHKAVGQVEMHQLLCGEGPAVSLFCLLLKVCVLW